MSKRISGDRDSSVCRDILIERIRACTRVRCWPDTPPAEPTRSNLEFAVQLRAVDSGALRCPTECRSAQPSGTDRMRAANHRASGHRL